MVGSDSQILQVHGPEQKMWKNVLLQPFSQAYVKDFFLFPLQGHLSQS